MADEDCTAIDARIGHLSGDSSVLWRVEDGLLHVLSAKFQVCCRVMEAV